MAETVGSVYVKVLTDTSGMKKQIEAALGGRRGRRIGNEFGTEFAKKLDKQLRAIQFDDAIRKQSRLMARNLTADVRRAIEAGATDVDFRLDERFGAEIAKISETYQRATDDVKRAILREIPEAFREANREAEKEMRKTRLTFEQTMANMSLKRAIDRIARQFVDNLTPEVRKAIELGASDVQFDLGPVRHQVDLLSREFRVMAADIEDSVGRRVPAAFEKMAREVKSSAKNVETALPDSLGRSRLFLNQFNRSIANVQLSLRRMGTGGWWDSLTNVAAAFVGSFGKIDDLFIGTRRTMNSMGNSLSALSARLTAFSAKGGAAGKVASGLSAVFGKLAGLLKNPYVAAAAAIGAVTIGLRALVGAISVIPVLVNSAASLVTSFGSALYFAGANAAYALPLLGGFVAAIAATVIGSTGAVSALVAYGKAIKETDPKDRKKAFEAYNEQLRKLGPNARAAVRAMQPLISQFEAFRKSLGERLFGGAFTESLKGLQPIAKSVGAGLMLMADAVRNTVQRFFDLGKSKVFIKDLDGVMRGLAIVVRDFGVAFVDIFAGLTAVFAAIMPNLTAFSDGIATAGTKFKDWAQSEEGRKRIIEFFDKAREIGGRVWEIITTLAGAFHDLFTGAADSTEDGGTIGLLDTILEKATAFRDFIREAKESGDLEKWLKDGWETAKGLYGALKTIGQTLQDLNTPQNRAWLMSMLEAVKAVTRALDIAMKLIMVFYNNLKVLFLLVTGQWGKLGAAMDTVTANLRALAKAVPNPFDILVGRLRGAIGWVSSLVGAIDRLISRIRGIPSIPNPGVPGGGGGTFASGGMAVNPAWRYTGEAGREAIIPLDRPLAQVDPSVRDMAALLRGIGKGSTVVTHNWYITAPTADPTALAEQVMNRIAIA